MVGGWLGLTGCDEVIGTIGWVVGAAVAGAAVVEADGRPTVV